MERQTKTTKTTEGRNPLSSLKAIPSRPPSDGDTFIPPHGGYQKLLSYHKALIVYDATVYF